MLAEDERSPGVLDARVGDKRLREEEVEEDGVEAARRPRIELAAPQHAWSWRHRQDVLQEKKGTSTAQLSIVAERLLRASGDAEVGGDGGGVKRPRTLATSAEPLPLEWPEVLGRTCGLRNLGNTCFVNATVQCLAHCPPLALFLRGGQYRPTTSTPGAFDAVLALAETVRRVLGGEATAAAPYALVRNLRSIGRRFRPGRQEDAHEFLLLLLDAVSRTLAGTPPSPTRVHGGDRARQLKAEADTIVYRIFGGTLRGTLRCLRCGVQSVSHERFLDLSVDMENVSSVDKALRRFTAPERLCGSNQCECAQCGDRGDAEKQLRVESAPNVLVLHLKRFLGVRKNSKMVSYAPTLDLQPVLVGEVGEVAAPVQNTRYRLFGVMVHEGASVHSGHYVAWVRGTNGAWLLCDDERVSQVGEASALRQQAYVLFYLRVPAREDSHVEGSLSRNVG